MNALTEIHPAESPLRKLLRRRDREYWDARDQLCEARAELSGCALILRLAAQALDEAGTSPRTAAACRQYADDASEIAHRKLI